MSPTSVGVASIEQLLVVRAELGVPEHLVRKRSRVIHFGVGAESDGNTGDDTRSGSPSPGRGLRDARDDVLRDGALVGHPEDRPRRVLAGDAEHYRAQGREQHPMGAKSVTSIGLCTRYSSFSTSTEPGPRRAAFRTSR